MRSLAQRFDPAQNKMSNKVVVVLLLLFSLAGRCEAQGPDCNPSDIDPTVMAEANIFPSESIMDILLAAGIRTVDGVRATIDSMVSDNSTLADVRRVLSIGETETAKLDGTTFTSPVAPADSADVTARLSYDIYQMYRPVCPYRWMYVDFWRWVFLFPGQKKYCYPIYNYWIIDCIYRHCHVHKYWEYWHYYFRCEREYRPVFMPMVCIISTSNGPYLAIEYQLRRIPRGCCCRRYWPWKLATDTCPAVMA